MREQWTADAPAGGWGHPWPQCLELAVNMPSDMWTLAGRPVVRVPAGTQALQRTVDCKVVMEDGTSATISVPDQLGALMLKAAAYLDDSRDRSRHLDDAAVLLATVEDPLTLKAQYKGSDRKRINALLRALGDPHHTSCLTLDEGPRGQGQAALALLATGGGPAGPSRA